MKKINECEKAETKASDPIKERTDIFLASKPVVVEYDVADLEHLFLTNAVCPVCGKPLYTSSTFGLDFTCENCDELYDVAEGATCDGDIFEILIRMTPEEYVENEELLRRIATTYAADTFCYTEDRMYAKIGWNLDTDEFPTAKVLFEVPLELQKLLIDFERLDIEKFQESLNFHKLNVVFEYEEYHVVYYLDENDEYHFFYENGKKPKYPDFEHKLICNL